MKTRYTKLILALSMLVAASLACSINAKPFTRKLEFKNVAVSPAAGDGSNLTLTVIYSTVGTEDRVKVSCSYQGGSGPVVIGSMREALGSIEARTADMTFTFSVTQPGTYMAYCTSSDDVTSLFASFRVDAAPPPAEPNSGSTLPKPGDFSSAGMWFYFDSATTNVPGFFIQHCLPGVNYNDQGGSDFFAVAPDGSLSGDCSFAYSTATILSGRITEGKWTEDGKVNFKLETQAVRNSQAAGHPGTATDTIVWLASGEFTDATYAKGTATWQGSCSTSDPEWAPCVKAELGPFVEASGTINWIIEFRK